MKKVKVVVTAIAILLTTGVALSQSTNWKVKEDAYTVSFKGGKVEGALKGLKATILFDETSPEKSKIYATVDINTINTGNGLKDKHAKSESALDVEKFSMIIFESTDIYKKGADYEAKGKLSIKGITKEIVLPFSYVNKGSEAVFKGSFSIVTKDFNITRMGTPEKLEIELTIPVIK